MYFKGASRRGYPTNQHHYFEIMIAELRPSEMPKPKKEGLGLLFDSKPCQSSPRLQTRQSGTSIASTMHSLTLCLGIFAVAYIQLTNRPRRGSPLLIQKLVLWPRRQDL